MKKTEEKALFVLSFLPERISLCIRNICERKQGGISELREVRLRRGGRSSVLLGKEKIFLGTSIDNSEYNEIVKRITKNSLYAYRDDIANGFIPLGMGVRVGVIGKAGYEGGRLIGISEISSLLFRIPCDLCAFERELYDIYTRGIGSGMLIYSPPGGGKTTALRSIAKRIGGGEHPLSVAIIDERREFCPADYQMFDVDILSGYSKRIGVEIAFRTMCPDIVMMDEIGAEDVPDLVSVLGCGVPVVATVHAGSFSELSKKPGMRSIMDLSAFSVYVGIFRKGDEYALKVDRS